VPITKCMLVEPEHFLSFLGMIVYAYFNSKNDYLKQYLTVFIQEFVLRNSKLVIGELFRIIEIIGSVSQIKIFLDQVLFWLMMVEENEISSLSEELLFNCLIYFIRKSSEIHKNSLQGSDSNSTSSKTANSNTKILMSNLISVFDFITKRITVNGRFCVKRTKQMIYCLGLIAKIGFSAKEKIHIGDLSEQLMIFNDNIPITASEIEEVNAKIAESS
ncbi:hypothetical protein THOM_2142, partial [Trachipleistophora hominis]